MADAAAVAQVRRFNRTVTQRVGALNQHYLARDLSLGEARLLWEVGDDGCEVRALRARLELDSGYTSRLLRGLEAAGLVNVRPSSRDGRVRLVRLTARGTAERARLDERSDDLAAAILDDLDPADQRRLVEAMGTVRKLLTEAGLRIEPEDPRSAAARFCIESYFAELSRRSNGGFDAAAGISAEPHELVPPNGCLLLVRLHGEPVGCGAVKFHPGAPCEIKRMWVAESTRGLGLGRRLLGELESRGRESGATVAHLETNAALTEAIALYRSAGYREVPAFNDEPFADYWFEKALD